MNRTQTVLSIIPWVDRVDVPVLMSPGRFNRRAGTRMALVLTLRIPSIELETTRDFGKIAPKIGDQWKGGRGRRRRERPRIGRVAAETETGSEGRAGGCSRRGLAAQFAVDDRGSGRVAAAFARAANGDAHGRAMVQQPGRQEVNDPVVTGMGLFELGIRVHFQISGG